MTIMPLTTNDSRLRKLLVQHGLSMLNVHGTPGKQGGCGFVGWTALRPLCALTPLATLLISGGIQSGMSLASSAKSSITRALFTFPSWANPLSVYFMPDDGADRAMNVVSFLKQDCRSVTSMLCAEPIEAGVSAVLDQPAMMFPRP